MKPSTSTTTAQRGNVLAVPAPAANETLRVDMVPGSEVQLPFEPGQTTVSRSENSLVFELDNGGTVTINNFFVTENEGELPTLLLPQGEEVSAAIVFADSGLDLTTAAGPAASSPNSSGSGEYADSAGDLLGGLERLGSLGTDQWGRSTEAPEYQQSALTVAGAVTDGPGTPDDPVGPVGPLAYIARGIMYTQNEDTLPELQVDLLSVSGGSATKYADGSAPADASLVFFDENGDSIADPMGWSYVDGKIIFTNPPAAGGIFYVTITDSNGNTYSMQIVVTPDETFDSKAQDAATPPAGGELAHGEWHSGKDTDNASGYDTTGSNLDDVMTFNGDIIGGKINTGHAANRAWGDDRITVNGNVDNTDMDFGTGTGRLDVNGTVSAHSGDTSIKMAHGVINVTAEKTGDHAIAVHAANSDSDVRAKVDILAGDAAVNLKAGSDEHAYGMYANNADVTVKAGKLNIEAKGGASASGIDAFGSKVVIEADTVNIDAEADGSTSYTKGILSSGSTVDITAHDVTIKAKGGNDASALRTQAGGDIDIDATGEVHLEATGGRMAYGMEINESSTVNVKGGSVDIKAGSENFARAVYGSGATINLQSENDMKLKATATNSIADAAGVEATNKSTANLTAGGKLDIDAASGNKAYGILAGGGSTVTVNAGSVDIDATGKSALGIHATGNGSTVDITAKDVTVNAAGSGTTGWARGIQAWGGENNSVSIHSKGGEVSVSAYGVEGYAMSAEGKGNKTLIEGAEKVTLKASHTGMSASTGDASNTIKGGEVHITVDGQGVSHSGMYATEGKNIIQNASSVTIEALKGGSFSAGMTAGYKGENTITSTGDVTVTAQDGTSKNYGLNAIAGSNSITSANGDVTIKATGNAAENIAINAIKGGTTNVTAANGTVTLEATGSTHGKGIVVADNSKVNIDARDVTIKVDGKAAQGSNGLRNEGGEIDIHSSGGKVIIDANGAAGWHGGMLAGGGGTSTIRGAKETVITAKDDGMAATGGTNIIDGTGITGDSARINAGGAMYANGPSLNKILNVDNVYMGSETQRAGTGMNVYLTGENRIENAKHVEIYAKTSGMVSNGGYGNPAANSIQANDVTINVANAAGVARGMMANERSASNSITAKDVTIDATGIAVKDNITVGMHAQNRATNTITSDGGAVSITARGGESYGMYTNGGDQTSNLDQSQNLIQGAAKVTVAADNIGMSANRGTNTIKDIIGKADETAVDIIADGASANSRSGMYAANHQGNSFSTLSENRIENVTGNVGVTASGSGGTNAAMNAYTYQQKAGVGVARNIITGVDGDVTASATGGDTNYSMRAFAASGSNPTENIIKDVSGTVTASATGGTESHGMSASGQSASNTIRNAGSVEISATSGKESTGMSTIGGTNTIENVTGNVSIKAAGSADTLDGSSVSTGMKAAGGTNTIKAVAGNVEIVASGKSADVESADYKYQAFGMDASAKGSNSISDTGNVSITVRDAYRTAAMQAIGGSNSITNATGVQITTEGLSNHFINQAFGLYAHLNGTNTISNIGANGVAISVDGRNSYAVYATNGGSNTITGVNGDITIKARSDNTGDGIVASANGTNTIGGSGADAVNGNLRVTVTGTALQAAGGTNSITINGDAELVSRTDGVNGGNRIGMGASSGVNRVTATGDILIKAEGGGNMTRAMSAEGGLNKVTAGGDLTISATGNTNAAAGENNAMFARSGGVNEVSGKNIYITGDIRSHSYDAGGTNRILGTDEDNRLVLNGNIDTNRGSLGTVGSATIDLGAGHNTAEINGTVSVKGAEATNTIRNVSDLSITSTSTGTAYALQAHGGGHNIIDNRLVVGEGPVGIIITANGAAKSYALYANGAGSTNEIYGSNTSANHVELHGEIYAAGGGKNILQTGAGDDYIVIDGRVTGDFQLNAGEGYDTLELRAASWADFSARYETWLSANFNDMSIENLQWVLGDSSGAVPTWLINLVLDYNLAHPDVPLDVDYAALGIAPPVSESAHAGGAEVHTDADSANTIHVSDAPSAHDASQHGSNAGDGNDANAAAHADNQSNPNPEHVSTLDDILQTDENGHAVNNHVDHNGDVTHDAIFGSGDDTVRIHGDIDGTEISKVDFDLGDGHNTLIVDGDARHADIIGGDNGNDISIHGVFEGNIDLGSGSDHVDLGVMQDGAVDLGAGDDTLILHGFTGGLLDGGEGDDTLILALDGLGGNDAFGDSGAFSGLFAEGAVKDFESLVLDMSGGEGDDTLDLGALLNSLKGLDRGDDLTVRITGDANDHVDTRALVDAGWNCQDNGDGTSHWTSADEATLTIIIQNGL